MSGTTANLNNTPEDVQTGFDEVTIVRCFETVPGGATLDVSGYTPEDAVLMAGHVIIEATATGVLKPLDVVAGEFVALPGSHTYKGVLRTSILKDKPFAAIVVRGTVNEQAFINGGGWAIPSGAKTALSLIRFTKD